MSELMLLKILIVFLAISELVVMWLFDRALKAQDELNDMYEKHLFKVQELFGQIVDIMERGKTDDSDSGSNTGA